MTKLWCIALSFGDTKTGSLIVANYISPTPELAVAQVISNFYTDNPGVRLPLAGVAVRELPREYLEAALRAMDEDEQKPPGVVQLIRPSMEAVAQALGQPKEAAAGLGYPEQTQAAIEEEMIKQGNVFNFAQWTDEMIANHFGQSKTKAEIDRLAGRKLNWAAIEDAARQSWRDEPA